MTVILLVQRTMLAIAEMVNANVKETMEVVSVTNAKTDTIVIPLAMVINQ